jgi:hypothetical protein
MGWIQPRRGRFSGRYFGKSMIVETQVEVSMDSSLMNKRSFFTGHFNLNASPKRNTSIRPINRA